MFALARAFAREPSGSREPLGSRVLVTTTTRILDPGRASWREGRRFGALLIHPCPESPEALESLRSSGPRVVLASAKDESGTKLAGIAPEAIAALVPLFGAILVEADGARGLSIKAPSEREPVLPSCATAVVGLVGLDAVGKPLDDRVAHRPELLGRLVGCAPGEAISPERILLLAASPEGLFKGTPPGATRILLLNKADAVPRELAQRCASLIRESGLVDSVVIGALGAPRARLPGSWWARLPGSRWARLFGFQGAAR